MYTGEVHQRQEISHGPHFKCVIIIKLGDILVLLSQLIRLTVGRFALALAEHAH